MTHEEWRAKYLPVELELSRALAKANKLLRFTRYVCPFVPLHADLFVTSGKILPEFRAYALVELDFQIRGRVTVRYRSAEVNPRTGTREITALCQVEIRDKSVEGSTFSGVSGVTLNGENWHEVLEDAEKEGREILAKLVEARENTKRGNAAFRAFEEAGGWELSRKLKELPAEPVPF